MEGFMGLMGYPSKNMEDFVTESDLKCANLDQSVSVENFSMWPRDCFCSILGRTSLLFALI